MKASTLLKLFVSLALLLYLYLIVDYEAFWNTLSNISLLWLVINLVLTFVQISISALKWNILCDSAKIPITVLKGTYLYMVGIFYNNFFPTSIGGDIVRGYELSNIHNDSTKAYASIFMERYTGLVTLFLIILIIIPFEPLLRNDVILIALLSILLISFIVASCLLFSKKITNSLERKIKVIFIRKFINKIINFQKALYAYKNDFKTVFYSFCLSICFYLNSILVTKTAFLCLGYDIPILKLVFAVPIMLMLFLIPISLGGIGLQEWAHTFVFGLYDIPLSVGLALGLLFRARTLFFALIGGVLMIANTGSITLKQYKNGNPICKEKGDC